VKATSEALQSLRGLHSLTLDTDETPDLAELESHSVGLSEVVLSPHTRLDGTTLRRIHFREKYGLTVLAVWRQGKAYRAELRDMELRFGDALLLYGNRDRLKVLGGEPDFIVLTESVQRAPLREKARTATVVAVLVLVSAVLGLLPIAIAAVVGAVAMVLTGCLNMRQAHRAINWPVVFIIAGMLPLGIAMQETGAAALIANKTVELVGSSGPMAVLAAMFLLSAVASQVMPNAAVAVLLAPIVMNVAADMGVSPYPLLMGVAVSASAAFMSPVAHPSNSLVMGPGGYRFKDFVRVGLPVTVVVMIAALLVLPMVWPL
jgi:di/tricarboxylate transporter